MSPVFPLTLALYAVSCALYLAQVAAAGQSPSASSPSSTGLLKAARVILSAAFASHALDIGILCVRGVHPFINTVETLSFVGWLTVGAFLVLTWRQALPLAGAVIVPVTLVLDVAARVGPAAARGHATTLLATLHIGVAAAGVALFAVAAADAAVYLYAEQQLKGRRHAPAHRPPRFIDIPPLETLDRFNRRCIQIGFPLFTVAMVTGAIWLTRLPSAGDEHGSRLLQPQYALSAVAWALYASLLLFRLLLGWRGRRAALVTLGGFAASLGVLAIYYVRDVFHWGAA